MFAAEESRDSRHLLLHLKEELKRRTGKENGTHGRKRC
jgi:hypothetical protein